MMKQKKLKGMTLIEVIISMLVFGVTGIIMVTCATTTCSFLREANHVTNKVNAEGPVAIVQDPAELAEAESIAESLAIADTNDVGETVGAIPVYPTETVNIGITAGGKTATITGKKYTTKSLGDLHGDSAVTNFTGDLEFYVIDPTEAPTT